MHPTADACLPLITLHADISNPALIAVLLFMQVFIVFLDDLIIAFLFMSLTPVFIPVYRLAEAQACKF